MAQVCHPTAMKRLACLSFASRFLLDLRRCTGMRGTPDQAATDVRRPQASTGAAFFDWYLDYKRLRQLFHQELPAPDADPEILDVGFGTSEVPSRLFEDGWRCVTAIDASASWCQEASTPSQTLPQLATIDANRCKSIRFHASKAI